MCVYLHVQISFCQMHFTEGWKNNKSFKTLLGKNRLHTWTVLILISSNSPVSIRNCGAKKKIRNFAGKTPSTGKQQIPDTSLGQGNIEEHLVSFWAAVSFCQKETPQSILTRSGGPRTSTLHPVAHKHLILFLLELFPWHSFEKPDRCM